MKILRWKVNMAWSAYELPPIDHWWEHLQTVSEVVGRIASDRAQAKLAGFAYIGIDDEQFLHDYGSAQEIASHYCGWEGDFREPARVFWLPDSENHMFLYGFVWKQDNNGTTYVVSPKPLAWLE